MIASFGPLLHSAARARERSHSSEKAMHHSDNDLVYGCMYVPNRTAERAVSPPNSLPDLAARASARGGGSPALRSSREGGGGDMIPVSTH